MKKLFLLLVMLVELVFTSSAQLTQVATLSHDGAITSFTSAYALQEAYNAAVDGDVITLSSGSFVAVTFEKRITVRGAGMGVKLNDSDPYIEPTLLIGNFRIKADGDESNNFKLEGILCADQVNLDNATNAQFSKCKFRYLSNAKNNKNTTLINCVVYEYLYLLDVSSMNFYGCYLKNINSNSSNSRHIIKNCILESNDNSNIFDTHGCVVKNSIFIASAGNDGCTSGSVFNSIWSGKLRTYNNTFYTTLETNNNKVVPEGMKLFKDGTFYQLTDEAKQYVGDDGTEVGIYGGSLPFDPTPTNPQIVKFNVAPKTTADGKLSVDIEVNAK